jgi:hypothetical protein
VTQPHARWAVRGRPAAEHLRQIGRQGVSSRGQAEDKSGDQCEAHAEEQRAVRQGDVETDRQRQTGRHQV